MFGYTVPSYGRLSPSDNSLYRRYYCEGCHQLRDGYGLTGTLTVNYDMTFNTILLDGVMGECLDFRGTTRRICVLQHSQAASEMMHRMAGYTLILTKWELYDDETDLPSMKTKAISFGLGRAIRRAEAEFPEYDEMVGKGFMALRDLELAGSKDAVLMGRTFGEGLAGPLQDIAGDAFSEDLREVFVSLTAAVYLMDAIDDLDEDFMDGTYNPLLPESGYVNARSFVDSRMYDIASLVSSVMGSLQGAYSRIRPSMRGNTSLCDNIVYFGIPESAKRVMVGDARAKASIKNIIDNRKERTSAGARRIEVRAYVEGLVLVAVEGADAAAPGPAAPAAPRTVPGASALRIHLRRVGGAHPHVPGVDAQPARPADAVAVVHAPFQTLPSLIRCPRRPAIPLIRLPCSASPW